MFFKNKIRFLLIIGLLAFLSSCMFAIDPHAPKKHFKTELQNASPDFRKGWADGCEAGMAAGSNSFYQMFYKTNKQDGYKLATSPEYSDAWDKAWWFCTHSEYVDKKSSIYGSMFAGYQ